ncbi:hypothetical protein NCCP2222_24490 [Sporosarcina sp. NCCP-2222]|uniref:hypothetical protein n=1 Tax=Sporosarcina sp. NCCP-2222 TaxID=2935073 RepID=UPI00207FE2F2|nr:hypothetical protein [Sporosarcina sp. NCCP-2222]GKV56502.1 hypothetical protein NCCP2222_24490 [Sporosarcina sp. NCCP-2222]
MRWTLIAVVGSMLAGCSTAATKPETDTGSSTIDWIEFVQWEDTEYIRNYATAELDNEWPIGKELGEVTFMLDGHAGTQYKIKNGDAAYLPIGTKLYEMEGYDPAFRIVANGDLYEVARPGKSRVLGDFLDIDGEVKRVVLQSSEDLSFIHEFSQKHTEEFIEQLLAIPYAPDSGRREGERIFFAIELKDGSMTRSLYLPETGYLDYGGKASPRIVEIFEEELKAAGN